MDNPYGTAFYGHGKPARYKADHSTIHTGYPRDFRRLLAFFGPNGYCRGWWRIFSGHRATIARSYPSGDAGQPTWLLLCDSVEPSDRSWPAWHITTYSPISYGYVTHGELPRCFAKSTPPPVTGWVLGPPDKLFASSNFILPKRLRRPYCRGGRNLRAWHTICRLSACCGLGGSGRFAFIVGGAV